MIKKKIYLFIAIVFFIYGCKDSSNQGVCSVSGTIKDYNKGSLQLFEITQSKNYFISKIEIDQNGSFNIKINSPEKSIYGIRYKNGFIYFINDVAELSLQTSESEFQNYVSEGSPETDQLIEFLSTAKKMTTEINFAEKLLSEKMVKTNGKFGNDPELLNLENKTDQNSLEMRNYIVNYIDTVSDKLLAIGAISFFKTGEEFNYLQLLYKKLENSNVKQLQKKDLKNELDKVRESFKFIARVKKVKGFNADGKQTTIEDLEGKYVFINIWASWCYLSREQMPYVQKTYEKLKNDNNIKFINVAIDDDINVWRSFLQKGSYSMENNLCDTLGKDAAILKRFGVNYIPSNYLLDKQGNIISCNLKSSDIQYTIDSVLKK